MEQQGLRVLLQKVQGHGSSGSSLNPSLDRFDGTKCSLDGSPGSSLVCNPGLDRSDGIKCRLDGTPGSSLVCNPSLDWSDGARICSGTSGTNFVGDRLCDAWMRQAAVER